MTTSAFYMKLQEGNKTHISHFHHWVSAYETNPDTVEELITSIRAAIVKAKSERESQIVDQDCVDHIFLVHPVGTVTLYRAVGTYEVIDNG